MDPISATLGICIGQAWDITKHVTNTFAGDEIRNIVKSIRQRIITSLPKNYDLIREVRRAELLATRKSVNAYRTRLTALPCHERSPTQTFFATRLEDFLAERLKLTTDSSIDFQTLTPERIGHVLDKMIDVPIIEGATATVQSSRKTVENAFLAEIAKHTDCQIPTDFRDLFIGQDQNLKHPPPAWYDMVALFITEEIKTNERFKSIFFAAELVDIKHALAILDKRIADFQTKGIPSLQSDLAVLKEQLRGIKDDTTDIKADVKELLRIMIASGVEQRAAEQGISPAAIRNIVERLGGQGIAAEYLVPWLEAWIDSAVKELSRKTNEGEAYEAAFNEAQRRFQAGQVAEAADAFIEEFHRQEHREAERRQEYLRTQSALLEGAIRFHALALDEPAIITKLHRLAAFQAIQGSDALVNSLYAKAGEHSEAGTQKGSNPDLVIAIAAYRAALREHPRHRFPLNWAKIQNNLGIALQTLGQREPGTARLEDALNAHRAALQERQRDRVPLDWARTQNNLGNTLATLGARETGTARLEEAVNAYRAALQERLRDRVPLDWAATQNNLGNALHKLGEREIGTAKLEEAIIAYQAALQECTRDRVPLDWAMTLSNLGNALRILGQRETGTARLEEAVNALRAALTV